MRRTASRARAREELLRRGGQARAERLGSIAPHGHGHRHRQPRDGRTGAGGEEHQSPPSGARFSATRSRALRARGFAAISAADGTDGPGREDAQDGDARGGLYRHRTGQHVRLRRARLVAKELLDRAIFQRVEGDHGQPTARPQQVARRGERPCEHADLVIDGDAQRLKDLRRRVDTPAPTALGAYHRIGELLRGGEWRGRASVDDRARDPARRGLLPIGPEEVRKRGFVPGIDDFRRRDAARIVEAHIERPIVREGESPPGIAQLEGREPEIEEDGRDTPRVPANALAASTIAAKFAWRSIRRSPNSSCNARPRAIASGSASSASTTPSGAEASSSARVWPPPPNVPSIIRAARLRIEQARAPRLSTPRDDPAGSPRVMLVRTGALGCPMLPQMSASVGHDIARELSAMYVQYYPHRPRIIPNLRGSYPQFPQPCR